MAEIIDWNDVVIDDISARLQRNEVGIFPCDTIYGICAKVSEETRERIYEIKERPESKRLLVLMDKDSLEREGLLVPEEIASLWPAPLTVILPTAQGDTLAVRVPDDPFLSALLPLTGPIFSTSVNLSGSPALTSIVDIIPAFKDKVDFIIEKKDIKGGVGSTLLDATKRPCRILRQGAYKVDENLLT